MCVGPKLNCSILILVCLCNILLFFDFMVLKFLLIKFSVLFPFWQAIYMWVFHESILLMVMPRYFAFEAGCIGLFVYSVYIYH